jgi:hypothetical protein
MRLALVRGLVLFASALPIRAQGQVWIVDVAGGPGTDFTSIAAGVDAAAHGDTLLVRAGGYGPFPFAGKSLRVIAEAGADVSVGTYVFAPPMHIGDQPAGGTTLLRGLKFQAVQTGPNQYSPYGLFLEHGQGTVWLESCTFGGGSTAPLVVFGAGKVVLENCVSTGNPGLSRPGLLVTVGDVTIHGGSYTGSTGASAGQFGSMGSPGGPGIRMDAGELYLSATQCVGGKGGMAGFAGGGCNPPGAGGPGLHAGVGQVRVRDAVLTGGLGGDPNIGGCPSGPDGAPYVLGTATLTMLDGLSSTLTSNSPVREGQTLTLRLTAETGGPRTALLLASQVAAPTFVPALSGVGLLDGPTRRIELGSVDPMTGMILFQVTVPELGSGVLAAPWIFQSYVCAGGTCSAGAATHTLWLDASL